MGCAIHVQANDLEDGSRPDEIAQRELESFRGIAKALAHVQALEDEPGNCAHGSECTRRGAVGQETTPAIDPSSPRDYHPAMTGYPFSDIEKKWQAYWETNKTFRTTEDPSVPREKRRYVLDMFPYPSAAGLHVGHPEGYFATDIYCRYLRMKGFQVLHPMGFDSFGLPAENYAIKTGTHPRVSTEQNIARFTTQIKSLGFSYDWDRRISSCEPEYYRWTQWIFLRLWEKGLAYEAEAPINWCPSCLTGLANEEVKDGLCDRCGTPVTRRNLRQWLLRITAFADRLLADLDMLDWTESLKLMQTNWIGRSEGANVRFKLEKALARKRARRWPTRSRSTRPVPTPCSAPPTWCWPPSTHSCRRSPRPRRKRRWTST